MAVLTGVFFLLFFHKTDIHEYQNIPRLPRIDPGYIGTVIPPNIAPLNFIVNEPGLRYYVRISSKEGKDIKIFSKHPRIVIPIKHWRILLNENRGNDVLFQVYVKNPNNQWIRFNPIANWISNENIDSYVVYRLLKPAHNFWGNLGIYQRNLENYDETPIILNRTMDKCCINCHSFCNNNPENMILHTRGNIGAGMLLAQNNEVVKVNTRSKLIQSPAAYISWHPSQQLVAFSVNKLVQFFHAKGESREVSDLGSDLMLYLIESNTITTSPKISSPERMETFPCWSPDGKYLYFCSSPKIESYISFDRKDIGKIYDKILYDLERIRYHLDNGTWGEVETLLSSKETGLSITMPRVSPDGRYLLFCMAKHGSFPVFLPSSDLYILDLFSGQYNKPDINSDKSESYHSWSSNSRWIVFSSKRRDGLCARLYFSYVDENGQVFKPFLLPQKNPVFYDHFQKTYNVPELIINPIRFSWKDFSRAALENHKVINSRFDRKVKLDVITGDTIKPMWQQVPSLK